jgi:DNA-binding response OmpR family regulator
MTDSWTPKILIVEPDARITELLVDSLGPHFEARLTCASAAEDALDVEILEPHDIVLTDYDLPGMDGLDFLRHLKELSSRPVILTSSRPTLSQAIEALRLGAVDYLTKPFSIPYVQQIVSTALHTHRESIKKERRFHELRQTVRRVLRDRKELNNRIDLICRDLVGAHRRLVHRVLAHEQAAAS